MVWELAILVAGLYTCKALCRAHKTKTGQRSTREQLRERASGAKAESLARVHGEQLPSLPPPPERVQRAASLSVPRKCL